MPVKVTSMGAGHPSFAPGTASKGPDRFSSNQRASDAHGPAQESDHVPRGQTAVTGRVGAAPLALVEVCRPHHRVQHPEGIPRREPSITIHISCQRRADALRAAEGHMLREAIDAGPAGPGG